MSGPLEGIKVVEIASIGPGPFAVMMLADMGAEVIRLDRGGSAGPDAGLGAGNWNLLNRGRPSVGVDLRNPESKDLVLRLCRDADAIVEGFRPGVMERLGLGPDVVMEANPKIVYGRMTGYGQEGPMASVAGHDINYISVAGVLGAIARTGERPLFPMNLVGDFGGGGMFLAFGVVCAILEAQRSGRGQVVDAAMVDGSAVLVTLIHAFRAANMWNESPGGNLLDSGAPFYEVYETADGGFVAVGAIEPQFHKRLYELVGLDQPSQYDTKNWDAHKQALAAVFREKTRDEWAAILENEEACATPVYRLEEAPEHPHLVARGTFTEVDGVTQPAPAPRFSRTPGAIRHAPHAPGADTDAALAAWGVDGGEIARLREAGAIS